MSYEFFSPQRALSFTEFFIFTTDLMDEYRPFNSLFLCIIFKNIISVSLCILCGESNYFANIIHARSAMSVFVRLCPFMSEFIRFKVK